MLCHTVVRACYALLVINSNSAISQQQLMEIEAGIFFVCSMYWIRLKGI